jgi:uncharacterized protein YprB with RNaseH-like and TPR domain
LIAPVKTLRKSDLEWLGTHYCKHGMTYLAHYNCYLEEAPKESPFIEKVGYFDIETTGFNADYNYMLSYCILGEDGSLIKNIVKPSEIRSYKFDERLLKDVCKDLYKFNRVVVYYGSDHRFDLPFARTRAIRARVDFPLYKDIFVTDVYSIVRNKLKLSRRGLGNACGLFEIPVKQHPGDPNIWMRAGVGSQEDLDYILVHNEEDVVSLKELTKRVIQYVNLSRSSI